MYVDHPHAEVCSRSYCACHSIRDIVELEIEEYFKPCLANLLHKIGSVTGEHFLADLDAANCGIKFSQQIECCP
jgi:hypothetical protein